MWTMPEFNCAAIAMARPIEGEITADARLPWWSLARATASSSVLKVMMLATGPNTSSSYTRMPAFTPASTVGL
jgi:hypothetical protein